MKTANGLLISILLFSCCNQQPKKLHAAKGELAFLLQYNNRMPSDVGFLTNHIMERRMANLMKENYEPFMKSLEKEFPLAVDSINQLIVAQYSSRQMVIVDVANDALWIDYATGDSVLHFADRTSLTKPKVLVNIF